MTEAAEEDTSTVFPACVVTRAAARKVRMNQDEEVVSSDNAVDSLSKDKSDSP